MKPNFPLINLIHRTKAPISMLARVSGGVFGVNSMVFYERFCLE